MPLAGEFNSALLRAAVQAFLVLDLGQLSEYLLSSPAAVALLGAPAWAQQQLPRAALLTRRADQR